MTDLILSRFHRHGPVVVGVVLAVIALLWARGQHDFFEAHRILLGIDVAGWALAGAIAVTGVVIDLVRSDRDAFLREQRLVRTAAALREATAQLERLAATDPLTNIANRRAFFESFGSEYRRAVRYGHDLAVLMIDLDNFKAVNDRGGHPFGDYVIAQTARTIRDCVRESDLVGRYGGEEFVVVLTETGPDGAAVAAEKLRAAIEAFAFHSDTYPPPDEHPVHLTVSIGVALLREHAGAGAEALLALADEALLDAKRAGKNRVHRHGIGVTSAGTPAPAAGR